MTGIPRSRALAPALIIIVLSTMTAACKKDSKQEAPAPASSTLATPATPATVSTPTPASAAPVAAKESDEDSVGGAEHGPTDAGREAGAHRKRRRHRDGGAAPVAENTPEPAPPAPAAAPTSGDRNDQLSDPTLQPRSKKASAGKMGDDSPYGGGKTSGGGASPLDKKSMNGDDPWAKPPPPPQ